MTQAYYRKTPQQALEAQNASAEGLSAQEARRRAEQYGPNKLSEGKKKSTLQVFLEQFKDLMVLILIIAAVISAFSGNVESTIVIFAVLVLNAILGTVQYEKAEKSLESLKAMASPTAKVMRGGVRVEIPSADVVPGDIVLLEAGDMVVADGRVLENFSLKVNESSLTGESEGVDKTAEAIDADQVALGDQKNMVFSGSLVTYGRATVLVTGTGMDTELGKIAALMNQTQQRRPPCSRAWTASPPSWPWSSWPSARWCLPCPSSAPAWAFWTPSCLPWPWPWPLSPRPCPPLSPSYWPWAPRRWPARTLL